MFVASLKKIILNVGRNNDDRKGKFGVFISLNGIET